MLVRIHPMIYADGMIRFFLLIILVSVSTAAQEPPPGVYRIGGGVTPPRVIQKSEPQYSEEARVSMLSGTVGLQLVVGEDGTVRDVHITKSLGLGLDEKARETVATWRFEPGMKDGRAVPVLAVMQVTFRLLDKLAWHLDEASCKPPNGATRPAVIHTSFPSTEPAAGEKASVAVSFDVDEAGVPANLHVVKSSDGKWEKEAIEATREWRFRPGVSDGKAVPVRCTWEFVQSESQTRPQAGPRQ
jgi:TonB family protein